MKFKIGDKVLVTKHGLPTTGCRGVVIGYPSNSSLSVRLNNSSEMYEYNEDSLYHLSTMDEKAPDLTEPEDNVKRRPYIIIRKSDQADLNTHNTAVMNGWQIIIMGKSLDDVKSIMLSEIDADDLDGTEIVLCPDGDFYRFKHEFTFSKIV